MEWKHLFKDNILNGGQDYLKSNSVHNLSFDENIIRADIEGLETFHVEIKKDGSDIQEMICSCPYAKAGNNCKHMAGALFAWEENAPDEEVVEEITSEMPAEEVVENEPTSIEQSTEEIDEAKPIAITPGEEAVDIAPPEAIPEIPEEPELTAEEKAEILTNAKNGLQLSFEIDDVMNYAIQQHGAEIVQEVVLKNTTDKDIDNLLIRVTADTNLVAPFEVGVEKVRAGEEAHLKGLKVRVNGDYLASLTERITCLIKVAVCFEDEVLISDEKEIVALAFDQWPGLKYTPEILAAFSMPNHPVVTSLIQLASQYLEKWTKDPSLAGYQFDDPNRVKQMAAAAYAAIQQKNITYANPPSSFEMFGQRIRLADAVLEQHLGTCMDMTLLYVACLEAMGLNPIMVMMHGHIFAGVWLVDDSFSDTIMDDPTHLEKRMASGINEILVVECTAMNAGHSLDFDRANKAALDHVADYRNFEFVIDVARARSMGIRPLPVRVMTDAGFVVKHEERSEKDVTSAPTSVGQTFDLSNLGEKVQATKQLQWERKLLDMSMRNMLINMRFTKAVVPLLAEDLGIIEDSLSDGEEFQVLPRPDNMAIQGEGIPIEALTDLGPFSEFIALEGKHKKLHSFYPEKELTACLTKMFRSAKTSLEENGASTLYLALGLLRWVEGKKSAGTVRYAPIILLPIDITRKSASKGYTMCMRDEDAQLNITLLEFLKQNYEIEILGLNPLPTDEHGLDLSKIYAIVRHAVLDLPGWDVVEAGFIGNFSFSQFVMWNDIHSRSDMLERNDIVRSLINGAVDWDCTIPESVNTDEAYLPITVDSSQLRAINMAAGGVSFVLHGPPGTGKSQTITAMIANALTKGQTILFVAEKMAALEVVQKRMEALGIGDFCLELHSNKATKKAVLDQLKKVLEISVYGLSTEYDKKIQDIRAMRANLDAYVEKLHERRAFGKTLRELIDIYETIPDEGIELRFSSEYAASVTQSDLDNQRRALSQLVAAGRGVGHPNNHPLVAVGQTVYTQTLKMDLEQTVEAYKSALAVLKASVDEFVELLNIDAPISEADWKGMITCAQSVISAEVIPAFLLATNNIDKEFDIPLTYMKEKGAVDARKNMLLQFWNDTFLQMDMNLYRIKYDEANKKFLGKGKAIANLVNEMQSFAKGAIVAEQIPALLADVEVFQKMERDFKTNYSLPFEWKQIVENYSTEQELANYKEEVKSQLQLVEQFASRIRELEQAGKLTSCTDNARKIIENYRILTEKENAVVDLLKLSFTETEENWVDNRVNLCNSLVEYASVIKDWIVYRQAEQLCKQLGLAVVCEAYAAGLEHEKVLNVYQRSIYHAIIISVIENEPVLNSFTGNGFNEQIVQFKKLDAEFMELTKEEMYYKLTHQLPSSYDSVQFSKELNILRRAISSNGRGMSIRSLFDQIPNILTRLCPCMLMSPISVAQYISADNKPFDIVIFDEASQLPTCKAVGVLARGKNAVIVGDPNQMPPTSFFAGNTVDEDNLDIEDLDSILDDCLALGMPSAHLQWHYRSRHESLIAFSNHEFYENSMLTFPSVNDREKRVTMVKVDSFFDRKKGRVNEGEADAIVAEIKRRYKDEELKKQSIGVVTFNISQQTLIEDKLQEAFQKDANFDKWANEGEERLFVKNLENVQGDERDIILFSIAFGPDEEGKLSMNFGPLNKEGGWKRLNVAVSRARSEMMVFSIMTSDMIDLKRTKSKGVESLKNFLGFAEKGRLQLSYNEMKQRKEEGILDRICAELDAAGYKYQKAVGHSKFKVDLAVINPFNPDEYILGIMLDGDSYKQSPNTKDREVAQIKVLNGLGWEIHRIWTMDWWDNRDKEIARLLEILEEKKASFDGPVVDTMEDVLQESEPETVQEDTNKMVDEPSEDPVVSADAAPTETVVEETVENASQEVVEEKPSVQMTFINPAPVSETQMVADFKEEKQTIVSESKPAAEGYSCIEYVSSDVQVTPMSTSEYVEKSALKTIVEHMQAIVDAEAPIAEDRLIRRTLRSFDIARASAQTTEATEKAIKKVSCKSNKQNGVKFYWKNDQDPDTYSIYRIDVNLDDKRKLDEVCQQELKNAVCKTLSDNGPMSKDDLIKGTIRTMGYGRSGAALVDAVERGIKYGRKTGEIILDESKRFVLGDN